VVHFFVIVLPSGSAVPRCDFPFRWDWWGGGALRALLPPVGPPRSGFLFDAVIQRNVLQTPPLPSPAQSPSTGPSRALSPWRSMHRWAVIPGSPTEAKGPNLIHWAGTSAFSILSQRVSQPIYSVDAGKCDDRRSAGHPSPISHAFLSIIVHAGGSMETWINGPVGNPKRQMG